MQSTLTYSPLVSCPFCLNISCRISCSRAFSRKLAIDELRRSSGGGVPFDVTSMGPGDETFKGPDDDDLFESVGEIGGETDRAPLTGAGM